MILKILLDTEFFRTLNKNHPQPASVWYKNRRVEIELISITRDDQEEPVTVTEDKMQLSTRLVVRL